jgi:hypothetical protein
LAVEVATFSSVEEATGSGVDDADAGGGGALAASMMTVRLDVAARPVGSVTTR